MEKILKFIKEYELIKSGQTVGVAVSGGIDSMVLLHCLYSLKDKLNIKLVVLHIDHGIRKNSGDDADFVEECAKKLGIEFFKEKIDSKKIAKINKTSLETGARIGRYNVFHKLLQDKVVDVVALAHHQSDQAETILMHIFRGSGISGAKGMSPMRNGAFIRPLLNTSKNWINEYAKTNQINFVEDETNLDVNYNRNFIRNKLLPQIQQRWPGVTEVICNFGKLAGYDDDFINSNLPNNVITKCDDCVKVSHNILISDYALACRTIFKALSIIGATHDIEEKHIHAILTLAKDGENGNRIDLPFGIEVYKEYQYITLCKKREKGQTLHKQFVVENFYVENYGMVLVSQVEHIDKNGLLYFDFNKLPKQAIWRFRETGDIFAKPGGGTKKLKDYLIEKKVPVRLRNLVPVLAYKNEIYVIANIEISRKVKVDENTSKIISIKVKRHN